MKHDADLTPQWWCIISRATGKLWTADTPCVDSGALVKRGPANLYASQFEAEIDAATCRHMWPTMLAEAIRLPAVPDQLPTLPETSSLVAAQIDIVSESAMGGLFDVARIEIRPNTGRDEASVLKLLDTIAGLFALGREFRAHTTRTFHLGPVAEVPSLTTEAEAE